MAYGVVSKTVSAYSYVRLSSDQQIDGDGLRRQLDMCREYAATNGLDLRDEHLLQDIGRSAWTGEHVEGGKLGVFLAAVRAGQIPKGSYLLVESFDRLSRQALGPALQIVLDLLAADINLVTLTDGKVMNQSNFGVVELMNSGLALSAAHHESNKKSGRLNKAWGAKRDAAKQGAKLTSHCPAWLKPIKTKGKVTSFETIGSRVAVVRRIFAECITGIGGYKIAKRLNADNVPPFGKPRSKTTDKHSWDMPSVMKILANRSVIGELQPHRLVNGRRTPHGDSIKDYFPKVIDDDLFYQAQASRQQRRTGAAGRKGSYVSNLFSGLLRCAYCDSKIAFENKGNGPKGGLYLVCNVARFSTKCQAKRWRYKDFETCFLTFAREVDLNILLNGDTGDAKLKSIDERLLALRGLHLESANERERIYELIKQPGIPTKFVAQKLSECHDRIQRIEEEQSQLQTIYLALKEQTRIASEDVSVIKSLIDELQQQDRSGLYEIRSSVAAKLRDLVAEIRLAPIGTSPIRINQLNRHKDPRTLFDNIGDGLQKPKDAPFFATLFRDGTERIIYPSSSSPADFEDIVYLGPEGTEIERKTRDGVVKQTLDPAVKFLGTEQRLSIERDMISKLDIDDSTKKLWLGLLSTLQQEQK